MRRPDGVGGLLLRAGAIYLALIAPWPGWNRAYAGFFCRLGALEQRLCGGRHPVSFGTLSPTPERPLNVRIVVAAGGLGGPPGRRRALSLDLDARGIGWIPTALFLALALATPMRPARLGLTALAGLLAIQLYLAGAIGIHIADQSAVLAGPGDPVLGPTRRAWLAAADQAMIVQLGAGFVVPVALWALLALPAAHATTALRRRNIAENRGEIV